MWATLHSEHIHLVQRQQAAHEERVGSDIGSTHRSIQAVVDAVWDNSPCQALFLGNPQHMDLVYELSTRILVPKMRSLDDFGLCWSIEHDVAPIPRSNLNTGIT
jgi:hypothetical protein